MNLDQARKILSTIHFLHYQFSLDSLGFMLGSDSRQEKFQLNITVKAPDTRNRSKVETFIHGDVISLNDIDRWDASRFIHYIWKRVVATLTHEAGELFKVNGIDVYNEHESTAEKFDIIATMFTPEEQDLRPKYSFNGFLPISAGQDSVEVLGQDINLGLPPDFRRDLATALATARAKRD